MGAPRHRPNWFIRDRQRRQLDHALRRLIVPRPLPPIEDPPVSLPTSAPEPARGIPEKITRFDNITASFGARITEALQNLDDAPGLVSLADELSATDAKLAEVPADDANPPEARLRWNDQVDQFLREDHVVAALANRSTERFRLVAERLGPRVPLDAGSCGACITLLHALRRELARPPQHDPAAGRSRANAWLAIAEQLQDLLGASSAGLPAETPDVYEALLATRCLLDEIEARGDDDVALTDAAPAARQLLRTFQQAINVRLNLE